LIEEAQLEDNVKLLGAVAYEDIPYYIALCDLGIIPFPPLIWWRVSNPLKLLEYLAMAKPVVLTDIEAHRQVIGTAKCGIFMPDNDPLSIKYAIMSAYKCREDLSRYGRFGRTIVRDKYSWSSQVQALMNYLARL
jgi:glycosyltransferase involved in cell wall biosynthesis